MSDEPKRLMPSRKDIGRSALFCVGELFSQFNKHSSDPQRIMGYKIPYWQRPLVWTEKQNIKFIESLWYEMPVGTYTFNRNHENDEFDDVLIDGQQRLNALQLYSQNQYKVLGYYWAEVTPVDRRFFKQSQFGCYISKHTSVECMKEHYNLLNFSGTSHKEDQYA